MDEEEADADEPSRLLLRAEPPLARSFLLPDNDRHTLRPNPMIGRRFR